MIHAHIRQPARPPDTLVWELTVLDIPYPFLIIVTLCVLIVAVTFKISLRFSIFNLVVVAVALKLKLHSPMTLESLHYIEINTSDRHTIYSLISINVGVQS